jgi:hypothetical protein
MAERLPTPVSGSIGKGGLFASWLGNAPRLLSEEHFVVSLGSGSTPAWPYLWDGILVVLLLWVATANLAFLKVPC